MRVLCSSRKPMRKTPVPGFPRALLSFIHGQKRRPLGSRLHERYAAERPAQCRFSHAHSCLLCQVTLTSLSGWQSREVLCKFCGVSQCSHPRSFLILSYCDISTTYYIQNYEMKGKTKKKNFLKEN